MQDSICKSDGSLHDLIIVGGGTTCQYKPGDSVGDDFFISMQGREVYKHAVRQMSGVCQELLERNGLPPVLQWKKWWRSVGFIRI